MGDSLKQKRREENMLLLLNFKLLKVAIGSSPKLRKEYAESQVECSLFASHEYISWFLCKKDSQMRFRPVL